MKNLIKISFVLALITFFQSEVNAQSVTIPLQRTEIKIDSVDGLLVRPLGFATPDSTKGGAMMLPIYYELLRNNSKPIEKGNKQIPEEFMSLINKYTLRQIVASDTAIINAYFRQVDWPIKALPQK